MVLSYNAIGFDVAAGTNQAVACTQPIPILTGKQLRKQKRDEQEAKAFNEKVLKALSRSRLSRFMKSSGLPKY